MHPAFIATVLTIHFSMVLALNMPFIKDAQYNSKTKSIDINVQYGGGCAEHRFELKMITCRESDPVQCDAKLIDLTTNDFCEALIQRKISMNIKTVGLDNSYYTGATINIQGAGSSKAWIVLSS